MLVRIIGNEINHKVSEISLVLVFGIGNFDELRRQYRVDFGWGNI